MARPGRCSRPMISRRAPVIRMALNSTTARWSPAMPASIPAGPMATALRPAGSSKSRRSRKPSKGGPMEIKSRNFLAAAAAAPAAAVMHARTQVAHPACQPDWSSIPTRKANKLEVFYKTKYGQPNGLALTTDPGQMWVLDQGAGHQVTLTKISDGSAVREFRADVVGPSGLVQVGATLWITST